MKNANQIVQIILGLAVAVLFYLHFSGKSGQNAMENTIAVPSGNFKVAYFEGDSLQNQFEYYKEVQLQLQAKANENQRQIGQMRSILANKYQELQKLSQMLSQTEMAGKQQEFLQQEKAFQGKEKMLADEFQEEQIKKLQDVKKKIEEFLKVYNQQKGYSMILNNYPDLIYYKDPAYDITADLVQGLNNMYKKK
ncbi:MAG: OmpH family outer membrane protein [Chitinophagia bacterium]|jgi:outer membrane protein